MAEQRRGPRAATSVRLLDLPVAWRVLLAPIAALATLAIWLQYAFLALMCDCQPKRQRINALVLLYQNLVAGYHPNSAADDGWDSLLATVTAAEPGVPWHRLQHFRLCYDDPFGIPLGETCRSAIGFVVGRAGIDPEVSAREWRLHPLIAHHGVKVGILPGGECVIAELPHCGPLSHGIALLRVVLSFMSMCKAGTLRCAVPGVMQVCDPVERKITFLCPQEERNDMLPFKLHDA